MLPFWPLGTLTGAAQLRTLGISSCCYIINVNILNNHPSWATSRKEGMAWYSGRPMPSLWSSLPSAPTHSCHGVCPCHIWRLSYSMTAGWGPLSSRCLSLMWQHPERQTGGGAILCVALPSQLESTCVVDPDPDPSSLMFSGSGSFHQQAKKSKKNLDLFYLLTSFGFFSLSWCKVPSKSNKQTNFWKKIIFCLQLVSHWRKKQDPDSNPLVSGTDLQIRIRTKVSQIHKTALQYRSKETECPKGEEKTQAVKRYDKEHTCKGM
jgi:hypothetical protein